MPEPLFSFIFVNYRSAELLARSLASLKTPLIGIPHEVIILNNDATEEGVLDELAKRYPATLFHLEENFGFGKANNVGAGKARGKYLVFLNPDTVYRAGDFQELASIFDTHPHALLGFRLETHEGKSEPWSAGEAPSLSGIFRQKISQLSLPIWESKQAKRTDWVSGAALAIPRNVFLELGGFDEDFFLYYEDVDLCLRAKEKGCPVSYYPKISFLHIRGGSHPSYRGMKNSYFKSQTLFFRKHKGPMENALLDFFQPLYRFLFF